MNRFEGFHRATCWWNPNQSQRHCYSVNVWSMTTFESQPNTQKHWLCHSDLESHRISLTPARVVRSDLHICLLCCQLTLELLALSAPWQCLFWGGMCRAPRQPQPPDTCESHGYKAQNYGPWTKYEIWSEVVFLTDLNFSVWFRIPDILESYNKIWKIISPLMLLNFYQA